MLGKLEAESMRQGLEDDCFPRTLLTLEFGSVSRESGYLWTFTSWEIDGETVETVRLYFLGLQNHCRW